MRKEKGKKKIKILVFNASLMPLANYFDLIWGFHNDLWRPFVLFDNAYDLHLFTQVVDFWNFWEF